MKIKTLINKLQKIQQQYPDIDVVVFDWRKNFGSDYGDGSSEGIYPDFDIVAEILTEDEQKYFAEQHDMEYKPFVQLGFNNTDYDDDGNSVIP